MIENVTYYIRTISISAIPTLLSIILHEIAHGWMANHLGDPTAKYAGRLTLNPIPHIDPFGTVILPLLLLISGSDILFGWAKPVPVNPYNLKNPRKDMMWVAAAGPITNLTLAIACAIFLRLLFFLDPTILFFSSSFSRGFSIGNTLLHPLALMCIAGIQINVVLAIFNLIPVPPADGGRIAVGLLPPKQAEIYSRIEPFGLLLLFAIIFIDSRVGILSRMLSFFTHLLL